MNMPLIQTTEGENAFALALVTVSLSTLNMSGIVKLPDI